MKTFGPLLLLSNGFLDIFTFNNISQLTDNGSSHQIMLRRMFVSEKYERKNLNKISQLTYSGSKHQLMFHRMRASKKYLCNKLEQHRQRSSSLIKLWVSNKVADWRFQTLLNWTLSHSILKDFVFVFICSWQLLWIYIKACPNWMLARTRISYWQMFFKMSILKRFANFTGKQLRWSLF